MKVNLIGWKLSLARPINPMLEGAVGEAGTAEDGISGVWVYILKLWIVAWSFLGVSYVKLDIFNTVS